MLKLSVSFLLLIVAVGCSKTNDMEHLEIRNGLYYEKNAKKPFTGVIASDYANSQIYGRGYNGIIFTKGEIIEGKKEGLWKEWYSTDKQFFEGHFLNGLGDGTHIWWHPNGEMLAKGNYFEGKRHGLFKKWYETGSIHQKLNYQFDNLHGEQIQYDASGKITLKSVYDKGKLICKLTYNASGEIYGKKDKCD